MFVSREIIGAIPTIINLITPNLGIFTQEWELGWLLRTDENSLSKADSNNIINAVSDDQNHLSNHGSSVQQMCNFQWHAGMMLKYYVLHKN